MSPDVELNPGDIVQLSPETCKNPMLGGCFMVVTEIRIWGAIGYVPCTGENGEMGGQAYYRASFAEMERAGRAPWIVS